MNHKQPSVAFNADQLGERPDRAVAAGRARHVVRGVYTTDLRSPLEQVVRAHVWEIVAHFAPDALVVDRSAGPALFEGDTLFVVSNQRTRDMALPGLRVVLRPGTPALPDDPLWMAGLRRSSVPRALVENLAPSRARSGVARTLSDAELADWVAVLAQQYGWGVSTTDYDAHGNVDRSLDPRSRDIALAITAPTDYPQDVRDESIALGLTGDTTAVAAGKLDSETTYSLDGIDPITELSPVHTAVLATDPTGAPTRLARTLTTTTYGSTSADPPPTGSTLTSDAPRHSPLRTRSFTAPVHPDGGFTGTTGDITETDYRYALSTTPGADTAGWPLRAPMSVTTVDPAATTGSTTTVTRYDPATGNVTSSGQPSAGTSTTDPGVTTTTYFGTGSYNPAGCTSTSWYGWACTSAHASQASGTGSTVDSNGVVTGNATPRTTTTRTKVYDVFGRATVGEDTTGYGTGTPTTGTTAYLNGGLSGRVTQSALTGGLGVAEPTTTYAYDATSGLPVSETTSAGTISTGYNDFGQGISTTDASGGKVTTTRDAFDRPITVEWRDMTVNAPNGTAIHSATYAYDQTASGQPSGWVERRGAATSVTYSSFGTTAGSSGTITGVFDADGALVEERLPGDITRKSSYDPAAGTSTLTWTRQTASGPVTWLSDTTTTDAQGRAATVVRTVASTARTLGYTYDQSDRLTSVSDQRPGVWCVTRTYGYGTSTQLGRNGNRLSDSITTGPDAGSGCQSTGTGSTSVESRTWTYDAADRLTSSGPATGISYDEYGRITTLPAALTGLNGVIGATAATISYRTSDQVASISQNGVTRTFTQDPAGQLAKLSITGAYSGLTGAPGIASGAGWTNHYPGGGDSPGWTRATDETTGAVSLTRYVAGLDGGLVGEVSSPVTGSTGASGGTGGTLGTATARVLLTDSHGDTASTATLTGIVPGTATPDGTGVYNDEYGRTLNPDTGLPAGTNPGTSPNTPPPGTNGTGGRYRSLATAMRDTTSGGTAGVTLMGARIYNPTLGAFLSIDPIRSGNSTPYAYPNDPINSADPSGLATLVTTKRSWWSLSPVAWRLRIILDKSEVGIVKDAISDAGFLWSLAVNAVAVASALWNGKAGWLFRAVASIVGPLIAEAAFVAFVALTVAFLVQAIYFYGMLAIAKARGKKFFTDIRYLDRGPIVGFAITHNVIWDS